MKYFRIFTGRYGGELTIGRISQEEFDRFKDADELDLIDHFADFDRETPWHEIDDIEHLSGPYADNQYYVQEMDVDGNEIGDHLGPFEYNHLYGREAYTSDNTRGNETLPVLVFHSAEKGGFGEVLIESYDDFDPEKFYVGTVETDCANLIESYFYDKIEIEPDFDYADSTGKGYYAMVGEFVTAWHDEQSSIDINEFFEYLED